MWAYPMGGVNTGVWKAFMGHRLQCFQRLGLGTLLLSSIGLCFAQKEPQPTRIWSVGPLTKGAPVMGISLGSGVATVTGPHVNSQTGSIFAATRSVVFAGDRIVLASMVGMMPKQDYQLLSLDIKTGEIKGSRELVGFGVRAIFSTNDAHVIVSGSSILRLTPDLKDDGSFDYKTSGHRFVNVQNISPDGSTLGSKTSPGYDLIDATTLKATQLTASPAVDTSVSSKGFVTNNPYSYTDVTGLHSIDQSKCGGRPQFLTDALILETGCKSPIVVDTRGNIIKALPIKGDFAYAGVSQNGKRFALQAGSFSGEHTLKQEHFVIYSVGTWEPITELTPDVPGEEQSWTAFSPDGSLFVVGSPLKLTLYRLP